MANGRRPPRQRRPPARSSRSSPPPEALAAALPAPPPAARASAWDAVYAIVRRIPRGRVMTYGQISELLERRLSPLAVGWAMHACPDDVPWQRVVNGRGGCSTERAGDLPPGFQRKLLEKEGIRFERDGRIDLDRYRVKSGSRPCPPRRPG